MHKPKTIVFIHQNMPAQFRNLAPALARSGHKIYYITNQGPEIPGLVRIAYKLDESMDNLSDKQLHYAQRAAQCLVRLRESLGVVPDLIVGHVSWGELSFVRDIYPSVPILGYFEWFHAAHWFKDFDPEYHVDDNAPFVLRVKNLPNYIAADICQEGITPTHWQYSTFPKVMRRKLNVIHDGIDTILLRRPSRPKLTLPNGRVLTADDEVVTYVGRGMEPIRGFSVMMRAVAELCRLRPKAQFVIIGEDRVAYGNALPEGESYKARMLAEVEVDPTRVHFLGRVPYEVFRDTLHVSAAHIYLTYPFILSWSLMEAMAAECLIFGSRTPPVEEVIVDGHNGVLVDFHDHQALAARIASALGRRKDYEPLRRQARQTILERYDLHGICLPQQKALINSLIY